MQNPYEKYKQQSILTMTGGDLVNLLFETAIQRLNQGILAMQNKDYAGANTALLKAQNIFAHLSVTLDGQYEVAGQLEALYDFFNYSIRQANMRKDPGPVEEILPMVAELKETFAQADKNVRMQRTGSSLNVN